MQKMDARYPTHPTQLPLLTPGELRKRFVVSDLSAAGDVWMAPGGERVAQLRGRPAQARGQVLAGRETVISR